MIAARALLVAVACAATSAHAFVPPSHGKKAARLMWAGDWVTSYGLMLLAQDGQVVVGHYVYSHPPVRGEIRGEAAGRVLTFTWEEGKGGAGEGTGTFELSEDSRSFTGTWTTSTGGGGPWTGKRVEP